MLTGLWHHIPRSIDRSARCPRIENRYKLGSLYLFQPSWKTRNSSTPHSSHISAVLVL